MHNSNEPIKKPSQENNETISVSPQNLYPIKMKFKRFPGSTEWVHYEDIKKFPQTSEED